MLRVCERCGSVSHTGPAANIELHYWCDHCKNTPDMPLFNQPKDPKPKRKSKRSRHPAEGGPDPVTGAE